MDAGCPAPGREPLVATAVGALLKAKNRGPDMPVPVLVGSWTTIDGLVLGVPKAARALIEAFWPGGLSIVLKHAPSLAWDLGRTRGTVMLRMPLHPVALELLARTGPLGVSSANRTGQPPPVTAEGAQEQLGYPVAVYLDGGPSGDLFVVTHVLDSPVFTRKGDNVEVEVPLTLPEALRGTELYRPRDAGFEAELRRRLSPCDGSVHPHTYAAVARPVRMLAQASFRWATACPSRSPHRIRLSRRRRATGSRWRTATRSPSTIAPPKSRSASQARCAALPAWSIARFSHPVAESCSLAISASSARTCSACRCSASAAAVRSACAVSHALPRLPIRSRKASAAAPSHCSASMVVLIRPAWSAARLASVRTRWASSSILAGSPYM